MQANNETTAYRDALSLVTHKRGALVRVLNAYRMGGRFVADGTEGTYVVISKLTDRTSNDYKLARVDGSPASIKQALEWGDYDYIVHASRIEAI